MPSRRRSENDASLISRRALEEIFSEKPAANQSEYVPSVLLELRTVMTEGANVPQNRTYSTPPPDLPPWLIGNFRLPPWEARLLHMLFTFSRPVLMIRGGSGSGKTSTLKLIDRYCLKTFEAERRVFKNKYGFRSPLLPIELQSLSDELTTRYTRAEQIKQQVDQTFIEISELIDGALNDHMPWKEFGALFRDAVVVPTMPHQASASRISAVRAKLRTYIVDVIGKADYLKDGVGDSVSSQQAKMALARLEAPRDRLVARVLLLAEIGRSLKSTDDIPLTLVLDNVDPMPEYLQRKLFRELESIGFGLHPLFFRIAIFSRLSTAARYFKAGARAGAESIEEFHSPDPASLVAHQAARFLLAPKRFPQFQGLPVEEKSHISRRILMVWRYLQDPGGEFRKILSGLSGSNIRNAYLLTINWCLSPEWKKVGGSTDMNEISGAFKYACAAVFLNEIAESLRRGLRLSWTSEVIDGCRGRHSNDPPAVAEEIAKGTAEIFARLIADHRLARVAGDGDSFPETEKCIRSFFMRELRRNLLGILTPRKELDREFLRGILYALEKAGAELYETLSPEEFSLLLHEIKVSFADDLILGMEDAVGDGLLHKMETEVRKAIQRGAGKTFPDREEQVIKERWIHTAFSPLDLHFYRTHVEVRENRFRSATILIDPRLEGQPFEQCAVNVFTSDGRTLRPLPLFVLMFLAQSAIGLQRQMLLENLDRLGFSRRQIDRGLLEMVRKERRLIFSSVRDHHDGIESWRDNPDPLVHISSSGMSYLGEVSKSPAYLQWALSRPKNMSALIEESGLKIRGSALERFRSTRFCFQKYIEVEREMVLGVWDDLFFGGAPLREDQEAQCQSPSLTVFVGALSNFMQDIAAHSKNLQRRGLTSEYAAVAEEAHEWVRMALRELNEHIRIHETEAPQLSVEVGFCQRFVETQFS